MLEIGRFRTDIFGMIHFFEKTFLLFLICLGLWTMLRSSLVNEVMCFFLWFPYFFQFVEIFIVLFTELVLSSLVLISFLSSITLHICWLIQGLLYLFRTRGPPLLTPCMPSSLPPTNLLPVLFPLLCCPVTSTSLPHSTSFLCLCPSVCPC